MSDAPISRLIAREAGGWWEASQLPYREAFAWAVDMVMREKSELFKWRTSVWAASLGLYSFSGNPPPPPEQDDEG